MQTPTRGDRQLPATSRPSRVASPSLTRDCSAWWAPLPEIHRESFHSVPGKGTSDKEANVLPVSIQGDDPGWFHAVKEHKTSVFLRCRGDWCYGEEVFRGNSESETAGLWYHGNAW